MKTTMYMRCWNGSAKISISSGGDGRQFGQVEKEFYDPHNYMSSPDNAASIQYKFYFSLDGMELHKMDLFDAAEEFRRRTAGDDGEEIIDRISWLEHKRWVVEHLLNGYQSWDGFDKAAELGTTHIENDKEKLHLCLRPSLLASDVRKAGKKLLSEIRPDKWKAFTNMTDPIDQVSLQSYLAYQKIFAHVRGCDLSHQTEYEAVVRCLSGDPSALNIFDNWKKCVESIIDGNDPFAMQLYPETHEKLIKKLEEQQEDHPFNHTMAQNYVRMIDGFIQSGKRAFRYTDHRKIDVDMTKYIPHILTYDDRVRFVVPASPKLLADLTGTNAFFQNFGTVFAVQPPEASIFVCIRSQSEWEAAAHGIRKIKRFFLELGPRSRTEWSFHIFIMQKSGVTKKLVMQTLTAAQDIQRPLFGEDAICTYVSNDPAQKAVSLLLKWNKKHIRYAVQYRDDCALSGLISAEQQIPQFVMETGTVPVHFAAYRSCMDSAVPETARLFDFYRPSAVTPLLLEDVAKLSSAVLRYSQQPGYIHAFQKIFEYFRNNTKKWKDCTAVLEGSRYENFVFPVRKKETKEEDLIQADYTLPGTTRYNKAQLAAALFALQQKGGIMRFYYGLNDKASPVYSFTCRLSDKPKFDSIFTMISRWKGSYEVYFLDGAAVFKLDLLTGTITLKEDSDIVRSMNKKHPGLYPDIIEELNVFLTRMQKLGLVKFTRSQNGFNVIYSSENAKNILTSEGRIFELYLYYQLKIRENAPGQDPTRKIESVRTSVNVLWTETDTDKEEVKNELDIVAQTGYRTVAIEVKASNELKVDSLYKFASITNRFGISPIRILVNYSDKEYTRLIETAKVFGIEMISGNDPEKLTEKA